MPNNLRALGIAAETIDYVRRLNEDKGGRQMTMTHRATTTVMAIAGVMANWLERVGDGARRQQVAGR